MTEGMEGTSIDLADKSKEANEHLREALKELSGEGVKAWDLSARVQVVDGLLEQRIKRIAELKDIKQRLHSLLSTAPYS